MYRIVPENEEKLNKDYQRLQSSTYWMGGSKLPDLTPYRIRYEKEFDLRGDPVGSGSRIRIKRGSGTTIEGSGMGILAKVDPDQEWDTGSRSKSAVWDKSRDQQCARDRGD